MKFTLREIGPGVRLHLCETDKFKSLTCKAFIQQELKLKEATSTGLLPLLLRRGSQRFPTTLHIARELEDLYAAEFGSDILKSANDRSGIHREVDPAFARRCPQVKRD